MAATNNNRAAIINQQVDQQKIYRFYCFFKQRKKNKQFWTLGNNNCLFIDKINYYFYYGLICLLYIWISG